MSYLCAYCWKVTLPHRLWGQPSTTWAICWACFVRRFGRVARRRYVSLLGLRLTTRRW